MFFSSYPAEAAEIVKQIAAMTVTKMRPKRFPLLAVYSTLLVALYYSLA